MSLSDSTYAELPARKNTQFKKASQKGQTFKSFTTAAYVEIRQTLNMNKF